MSTNSLKAVAGQRTEAAFAMLVIGTGVGLGLLDLLFNINPPRQTTFMAAILVYGIIEVPRIENFPGEQVIEVVISALLAVEAALLINILRPGLIASVTGLALGLLMAGTIAVAFRRSSFGGGTGPAAGTVSPLRRQAKFLGVAAGLALLAQFI